MKLSLVVALAGMAGLFAVTLFIGTEMRIIGSLSEKDAGHHVVLNATVLSKTTSNGNVFMTLGDPTGNITVVIFGSQLQPKVGYNILIIGRVNIYKGELEVIADSVK